MTKLEACAAILAELRATGGKPYMQYDEPEMRGPTAWAAIRDWGRWVVPDGEEDDGDYDWEVPDEATSNRMVALRDKWRARWPQFQIDIWAEEKNWTHFSVAAPL